MPYNYSNETMFGIHNDVERYGWMSFNMFIVTTSFIGDSLIFVGSIKYRAFALHEVITAIIQHIAICDLLLSLMILQRTIVLLDGTNRLMGVGLCYIKAYLGAYTMSASVLLVCAMVISKFLLLKYPLRTGYVTTKHAHKLCASPLHKSSNPFPIGRIRVRPKMNFQKFCIQVQKNRTENKESKSIIHWRG